MSDINVLLVHADAREDRRVTTGTKAWELFSETPEVIALPLNLTLLKSCDVCGVFWGAFAMRDPKANAAHVAQLFKWWDEGKIAPRISATYPLTRAGEAITAIAERRAIGKLVVTLD